MTFKIFSLSIVSAALFALLGVSAADAKPSRATHYKPSAREKIVDSTNYYASLGTEASILSEPVLKHSRRSGSSAHRAYNEPDLGTLRHHSGVGPRPSAWCGWYMRTRHGGGEVFNRAWTWSKWGRRAEPQVGAIVVWPHHVGEIVGRHKDGRWIVLSGNDSHRVRQRPRSIAGAIVRI